MLLELGVTDAEHDGEPETDCVTNTVAETDVVFEGETVVDGERDDDSERVCVSDDDADLGDVADGNIARDSVVDGVGLAEADVLALREDVLEPVTERVDVTDADKLLLTVPLI